jgi:hypothetical protein
MDLMRQLREAHDGHIKPVSPMIPRDVAQKVAPKEADTASVKSKFFLEPIQEGADMTAVRDVSVSSLQDRVLDMTPEDRTGLLLQKRAKSWGKKKRREKLIEAMVSGKQAFIRNAVSQMEGVNPKGEKYHAWVE